MANGLSRILLRARGKPDKPYSGKFVLRIDPQLHRKLAALSSEEGASLNKWVESKLSKLAER